MLYYNSNNENSSSRFESLPLKVMCDEGPEQQSLPCAGGLVGGEHQQERDEERRHLLEEPGQWRWDRPEQRRGPHVAPVGELRLPVMEQVCEPCQDEAQAQGVHQGPVTVHLRLARLSLAAKESQT